MRMLVLPMLVPLGTAAVLMLAPKRPTPQRWVSLIGSIVLLVSALLVFARVNAAGIQVLQVSACTLFPYTTLFRRKSVV